ncbi:MAG: PaaI family thioesterase [Gammaproteobacteria bacterium]|jgi:uncharacterized protein (TIGR00369 family)|nr:thioesterase [Gammaproteobacteria bacterium]MDP6094449.1 PaaI family thioesterase [Gammaproteobacteria bacterium]|tara:strand:+ start:312 stop:734 length:423 start_codon:yes stop_codon:yes gene_type:complete
MAIHPTEYDIPASYQHWVGDKAEDYIGPFFFYMDGENPRTAFRIQQHNCNAHDSVHGGVLMAFADYTLCLCANGGSYESVATVSCNNEFTAPAYLGDLLQGSGEVTKRGGSMVFARCVLRVEDTVILTSSAVIKRIRMQK